MKSVELVYDYVIKPCVPMAMGTPKEDQLQGTDCEKLIELAGRVCYDSLGKGRSSSDYHKHIVEVNHGSVLKHYNFTVDIFSPQMSSIELSVFCLNRPGVWTEFTKDGHLRITLNVRSAIEWLNFGINPTNATNVAIGHRICTALCGVSPVYGEVLHDRLMTLERPNIEQMITGGLAPAESDEERWLTFFLSGSRGFSHEQVRHKYRTAVSQRSTRYVDEEKTTWHMHPLMREYLEHDFTSDTQQVGTFWSSTQQFARDAYAFTVNKLQAYGLEQGLDKLTARKQARGAARGMLGNALHTEMLFSASIAQWKRMFAQRLSLHADAEIRNIYALINEEYDFDAIQSQ